MITLVETYRGVNILRADATARGTASICADTPPVRFHAHPEGVNVVADSIQAVKAQIDKVLDAPPDSPGSDASQSP